MDFIIKNFGFWIIYNFEFQVHYLEVWKLSGIEEIKIKITSSREGAQKQIN